MKRMRRQLGILMEAVWRNVTVLHSKITEISPKHFVFVTVLLFMNHKGSVHCWHDWFFTIIKLMFFHVFAFTSLYFFDQFYFCWSLEGSLLRRHLGPLVIQAPQRGFMKELGTMVTVTGFWGGSSTDSSTILRRRLVSLKCRISL